MKSQRRSTHKKSHISGQERAKEIERLKGIRTQLEAKILTYNLEFARLLEDLDKINAVIHRTLTPPASELTQEILWDDLPVRVRTILEELMIGEGLPMRTYGDLLSISLHQLYLMRNIGKKSINHLQTHLATLGLSMK